MDRQIVYSQSLLLDFRMIRLIFDSPEAIVLIVEVTCHILQILHVSSSFKMELNHYTL